MRHDDLMAMLADVAPDLAPAAEGAAEHLWTFVPIAGSRAGTAMRLGDRWIVLEAALHADAALDAPGALRMQSALPSGIKVVRWHRHFGLRAEIPILVETSASRDWVRRQVALVHSGLRTAIRAEDEMPLPRGGDDAEFDPVVIAERCTAGGWRASVSQDGSVRVELATRSAHRIATLTGQGRGVRAAVTLDTGAAAGQGPDVRLALAAFMLRATRSLRWVRAFGAGPGDDLEAVGFECVLVPPGDDPPVVMALDALATACELCGREAEALAESSLLAGHYLAFQKSERAQARIPSSSFPPGSVPASGAVEIAVA